MRCLCMQPQMHRLGIFFCSSKSQAELRVARKRSYIYLCVCFMKGMPKLRWGCLGIRQGHTLCLHEHLRVFVASTSPVQSSIVSQLGQSFSTSSSQTGFGEILRRLGKKEKVNERMLCYPFIVPVLYIWEFKRPCLVCSLDEAHMKSAIWIDYIYVTILWLT